MIKAEKTYQSAADMPPDLAEAVLAWTLSLADTKQQIGLQFSHWVTGTPALEGAVGAAALTQDELGHARSLYGLLRGFPGVPEGVGAENDLEARKTYYAPQGVITRWESWLQVIAINLFLDSALEIGVKLMGGSAFHPLAGRTAKILQEERFHRIFGESWLKRLSTEKPALREPIQQQINWAFSIGDRWIGPENDPIIGKLVAYGVLNGNGSTLREQWLDSITPIITNSQFERPAVCTDWSTWDYRFRQCNDQS